MSCAVSGSMEPAFQRGDILFLNNQDDPIRVGEIVVFKIKDRDIPIVHRVMKVHEKADGRVSEPFSAQANHPCDPLTSSMNAFRWKC
jgi:signal peptidase I